MSSGWPVRSRPRLRRERRTIHSCCLRLLRARDGDSIAAIVFRLIESLVGELYQKINSVGGFVKRCDTNRNSYHGREFTFSFQVELFEASANFVGADGSLLQRTFRQDDDELFASIATGQLFGAHTEKQRFTYQAERIVTCGVPEVVVITFEMIDIEHHHRQRGLATTGAVEFAVQSFLHVPAIVEPREWVTDCLGLQGRTKIEVGNSQSNVFGERGRQLSNSSTLTRSREYRRVRGIVSILEKQHANSFVARD